MNVRSLSLRTQLVAIGLVVVIIPLLLLFLVADATVSDEEVGGISSTTEENDDAGDGFATEENSGSDTTLLAATTAILALLAGGAVWIWSGRAVRPISDMTDVADEIQRGSLDRRIALSGEAAEVQALGDSFDRMLDRLATASTTQQQLVEDASHDLRTPLAALAVNNEVILAHPNPSSADFREAAERNEALVERMQNTVDDLMRDARARSESARQVANDLVDIVARVANQQRVATPDVTIAVTGPSELRLGIDGPNVERALTNLVDNAARYAPPDTSVDIDIEVDVRGAAVSVTDSGPGIDPAQHDRIFDRYFQGGDDGDGTAGVGLALVKQVADAHRGIEIASPPPDRPTGTRFTLRL